MSPDGAPSLVWVNTGMNAVVGVPVAVVGVPVAVVVPSADRVVLVIMLSVPVSENVESVLSGEELESEDGVAGSEIDTSESVLGPGIVMLLVLVMELVLIVVLGVVVSGTVGSSLPTVSRSGLLDGAVLAVGPAALLKSGNASEPAVLTALLKVVKTVVLVSTAVESKPALGKSPVSLVLIM